MAAIRPLADRVIRKRLSRQWSREQRRQVDGENSRRSPGTTDLCNIIDFSRQAPEVCLRSSMALSGAAATGGGGKGMTFSAGHNSDQAGFPAGSQDSLGPSPASK